MKVALPLTGGCLCGAVRYELRARPYMIYVCHCSDCRRQSGSAFGMSMPSPRAAFAVTVGEPASFKRVMPSGREGAVRFCATCATRVFADSSPDVVTIRPGTLDDTSWIKPSAQNWTSSALEWACLDDVLSFEGNPPTYDDVAKAWRAQGIVFEES